ncbi:unnamed protein product [Clonostachys chloroleuca]|uniref:C2H2-type domain-containing protein n=1 Tax=Clonostachys chloroleuca TaxID=1926264 RepID=A0AA35LXJ6_9HYPO|nr:unnamed protein product [Clonostachys chloroleuca]
MDQHHHQHHQQLSQQSHDHEQQQQQQHLQAPSHPTPTTPQHLQQQQPQDVLAEARKNLQVLIDSGLSRDLLHQLVDDSRSLQLTIPSTPSLVQPSQPQQPQQQSPLSPQSPHSQSQPPTLTIPPPPQCPPPPPPTQQAQHHPQGHTTPPTDVKMQPPPPPLPEDMSSLFAYPAAVPFAHRPRISVSSTSSGSSGTGSIWSNHSAQSSMSWASAGSSRMQAPLPLPPQMTSPTGGHMMAGPNSVSPVSAGGSPANKQNIYWCTSCETSFKRKYDWKRHEDEFHERWRKYPCPEPGCNRSFWGSNSFNQHHKQCHGCTTCPHAEKVVRFLRKRKYWACGFCSALHPARERHVEHVARHFESGMTKGEWMHSRVVYGLLHQPLIHEAWDALVNSKQSDYSGRRPRFSWHPSKTGRAQGFLEKENPGQLQDLLEFFSGDEADAQWIVSVAYDLADIVMDNVQLGPPQFQSQPQAHPYSQDPRISFAPLPPQAMMQSADPNTSQAGGAQNPYAHAFQGNMFMNPQSFGQPTRSSPPDSTSHSPLPSTHSPIAPTQSPAIKQERRQGEGDGGMDFEYAPTPVVFEDWESGSGTLVMDDSSNATPTPGSQAGGWPMMQYFGDPRVAS